MTLPGYVPWRQFPPSHDGCHTHGRPAATLSVSTQRFTTVLSHIATGAEPEAFLKDAWNHGVAENASEDHHRLREFRLHDLEDFVSAESKTPVIFGKVQLAWLKFFSSEKNLIVPDST